MRLAFVNLNVSPKKSKNLSKILSYMQEAKRKKADLIVFPEMSEFYPPNSARLDNLFLKSLEKECKKLKLHLIIGLYESVGKKKKNTVFYIDNKGYLAFKHSKTHLFDAFNTRESEFFESSLNPIKAFDTVFARFGILICYELRFCEIARKLSLDGAKMLFVPSAWYKSKGKKKQFKTLLCARAIENTVFVLGLSQSSNCFIGSSYLFNPLGKCVFKSGKKERLSICDIDFSELDKMRKLMPCLEHRKAELLRL